MVRFPSSSMISGMAEAKRARPTVRNRTWDTVTVFCDNFCLKVTVHEGKTVL